MIFTEDFKTGKRTFLNGFPRGERAINSALRGGGVVIQIELTRGTQRGWLGGDSYKGRKGSILITQASPPRRKHRKNRCPKHRKRHDQQPIRRKKGSLTTDCWFLVERFPSEEFWKPSKRAEH